MKPFGIDLSRHQGVVNWDVVARHLPRVEFVGIRATISWGYVDPFFKSNYAEAKRVGIARFPYHVIYPKEDHKRQMDNFIAAMDGDWGEGNPVIDVELNHGQTAEKYRETLLNCLIYLHGQTGRMGVIYSRANFMDSFITGTAEDWQAKPPAWLNNYDYWLAQYLLSGVEHPGPPLLPKGVSRNKVIIHQSSEKGDPIGMPQAGSLDYNRWQPEAIPLAEYIEKNKPVVKPPVVDMEALMAKVKDIEFKAESLKNEMLDVYKKLDVASATIVEVDDLVDDVLDIIS